MGEPTHTVWCIRWRDPDHGLVQEWYESEAEAKMVYEFKAKTEVVWIERVSVPTTLRAMVRWLNIHFNTDNG